MIDYLNFISIKLINWSKLHRDMITKLYNLFVNIIKIIKSIYSVGAYFNSVYFIGIAREYIITIISRNDGA